MDKEIIVVSACLCGVNCRYSGDGFFNEKISNIIKSKTVVPVCPEQLGGLPTPRAAAEIVNGTGKEVLLGKAKVISKQGEDKTKEFVRGAKEALNIAKRFGAKKAILKAKSPSCGCGLVYDGTFSGNKIKGNGVTAELFIENGIKVITEEELEK